MSRQRVLGLLLLAASTATIACGDYSRTTSPAVVKTVPHSLEVRAAVIYLSDGTKAKAVKWASPQTADVTVSGVIGPEGGSLELPGSDFSLVVPAGALSVPTTITVVAKAGAHVVYDMQPHGLTFLVPVIASQGLRNTVLYGTAEGNSVRGAYLPDDRETIGSDDTAMPAELQASTTFFSGIEPVAERQNWLLTHFSRYILVSGVWLCVEECLEETISAESTESSN